MMWSDWPGKVNMGGLLEILGCWRWGRYRPWPTRRYHIYPIVPFVRISWLCPINIGLKFRTPKFRIYSDQKIIFLNEIAGLRPDGFTRDRESPSGRTIITQGGGGLLQVFLQSAPPAHRPPHSKSTQCPPRVMVWIWSYLSKEITTNILRPLLALRVPAAISHFQVTLQRAFATNSTRRRNKTMSRARWGNVEDHRLSNNIWIFFMSGSRAPSPPPRYQGMPPDVNPSDVPMCKTQRRRLNIFCGLNYTWRNTYFSYLIAFWIQRRFSSLWLMHLYGITVWCANV